MLWQPPKIAWALPNSHGSSRFTAACGCHDHGDTIGGNGLQDLLRVTAKGRICISWCPFNEGCFGILMDLDDLEALFVCFFKSMKPKATENKNTSKTFLFSLHFNFYPMVSSFLLGCGCGFNTKWSTLGTSGACVTSGIVAMDGGAVGSGVGWDFDPSSASASGGSFSGVSTFNQRLRSRTPETKPKTLGKSAGSGARKSLEEIGASRFSCRSAISGQVTK